MLYLNIQSHKKIVTQYYELVIRHRYLSKFSEKLLKKLTKFFETKTDLILNSVPELIFETVVILFQMYLIYNKLKELHKPIEVRKMLLKKLLDYFQTVKSIEELPQSIMESIFFTNEVGMSYLDIKYEYKMCQRLLKIGEIRNFNPYFLPSAFGSTARVLESCQYNSTNLLLARTERQSYL